MHNLFLPREHLNALKNTSEKFTTVHFQIQNQQIIIRSNPKNNKHIKVIFLY